MPRIRVLLIEDNRLLREGIANVLNDHGDFDVIARSEDGDAVRLLKESGKEPDIVLLDLGLERASSLKLMRTLQKELPKVKVIAMDILPDQVDIVEFVKAGGSGFILKSAPLDDYVNTIKTVASGGNVIPPLLTPSLFTQILESALKSSNGIPDSALRLTAREKEIVDLISEGLSNKEMAARLHIATHTVKSHIHNVLEKLALNTRLEIAAFARKAPPE